jgi:predicted site-specific integrase-resolvase
VTRPLAAPAPRMLTRAEVGAIFRVGPKALAGWVAAGKLHGVKTPGGHWRFPEPEVLALLKYEAPR